MKRLKKVLFCGVEGSFTHAAALQRYGEEIQYEGTTFFQCVFDEVAKGHVDSGVIPIENTLAGSLYEHYDLLERSNLWVSAEVVMRIEHHLLVKAGRQLKHVKKVLSHPKALEQCRTFFMEHPQIEAVACSDTATAASLVAEGNGEVGAIASCHAAERYGLEIIAHSIEDHRENYTRFFCIEKECPSLLQGNKCSLVLILDHFPGRLYQALGCFQGEAMNLTKIDSRPLLGKPFEYLFYIDVEGNMGKGVMESLQKICKKVTLLGCYKRSQQWIV
jgi:prephenate dehydratase